MVTTFTCHDSTVLSSLGKQSKQRTWSVQASLDSDPMQITVDVDRSILSSPQVSVACDGTRLFPALYSHHSKEKLFEDFRFQWPFRGTRQEHFVESSSIGGL